MAKLKYKSGNNWVEFPMGIGGTLDQQYPVGSFYYGPVAASSTGINSTNYGYTFDVSTCASPAATCGGSWTELTYSANSYSTTQGSNASLSYTTNVEFIGWLFPPSYGIETWNAGGGYESGFGDAAVGRGQRNTSSFGYGIAPMGYTAFKKSNIPYWKVQSSDHTSAYQPIFYCRMWQRIA